MKKIFTDLNNDNIIDTIILSSSLEQNGSFNRISILMSGVKRKTFIAKDSWTIVDKWFLDSNKNVLQTNLLFFKKTDKHAVILLFGILDGAGYRGEFSMINIENNNIKMVFDHTDTGGVYDVEDPVALTDLENNGRLCFIYKGIGEFDGYSNKISQEKGMPDIGTYTPYFVYPISDTCHLDKPLTKKYNEDHYVFAGYNYSEKIRILYPRNKKLKPRIYKGK